MNIPSFEEYRLLAPEQRRLIRQYQKDNNLEVYSARKGLPSMLRGKPNFNARGPRGIYPHRWKVGTDPVRHAQYRAYLVHKAQANYRQEDYALTFGDFELIWQEFWEHRGRRADSLVLTRIDPEMPWCRGNIELITRLEQLKRMGEYRILKNS